MGKERGIGSPGPCRVNPATETAGLAGEQEASVSDIIKTDLAFEINYPNFLFLFLGNPPTSCA